MSSEDKKVHIVVEGLLGAAEALSARNQEFQQRQSGRLPLDFVRDMSTVSHARRQRLLLGSKAYWPGSSGPTVQAPASVFLTCGNVGLRFLLGSDTLAADSLKQRAMYAGKDGRYSPSIGMLTICYGG